MPTPPLTLERVRPTVQAVAGVMAEGGFYLWEPEDRKLSAFTEAAARLSMTRQTVRDHCKVAEDRFGVSIEAIAAGGSPTDEELESLPDGESVILANAEANAQYIAKVRSNKARIIPVRKEPFGIAFIGDPHMDNKGADLRALHRDLELIRATGMRAVNMGDLLDNFHHRGRLAKKQAANRMTIKEGLAAARWFIRDSGVRFDAHLLGNHDQWAEEAYAEMMNGWAREAGSRFYDWEVTIHYTWDGGKFSVCAAHDFKGHSVYNSMHGPMKRALEDGTADLYVAGHKHTAGESNAENGWRSRKYWFLRVRGYKAVDEYAHVKQFPQQREGASGVGVINPAAETMGDLCRTFESVEAGAEYLQFLRAR